jgi:hypothetical protein
MYVCMYVYCKELLLFFTIIVIVCMYIVKISQFELDFEYLLSLTKFDQESLTFDFSFDFSFDWNLEKSVKFP